MFSQLSFSETLLVTVTGLIIVFSVLILLVFIFTTFGKALKSDDKQKTITKTISKTVNKTINKTANKKAGGSVSEDSEIIAVITAAAMNVLASTGKNYTVISIKRNNRRPAWATAGILKNTRSF